MHQTLGIVLLVLLALVFIVIGMFCLNVIEEERSKIRKGGGKSSPIEDIKDDALLDHVRKSVSCC